MLAMDSWRPWYRVTVTDREGGELTWDAGGFGPPDVQAVDVVARLALLVRRDGGSVKLTDVTRAMLELLDLTGMTPEMCCQDEPGP